MRLSRPLNLKYATIMVSSTISVITSEPAYPAKPVFVSLDLMVLFYHTLLKNKTVE